MVVLASFTQPTGGIRHRQNNTTVYVNDNNLGKGTLYIAESRLSWVSDSGNGFSIDYPHISLHAVSRDLSVFPQECLFLMLDAALADENEKIGNGDCEDENENENENENGNGNENDSEVETTELRLVPDDRGMLDAMFHAMNACQALHPDPEESLSDEDFFEDADDEIPVEETGSRMASLSIENMDRRGCIFGMEEDLVEDNILGRQVGLRAENILGSRASGVDIGEEVEEEEEEEEEEESMGVDYISDRSTSEVGSGAENILGRRASGADLGKEEEGMRMDEENTKADCISDRST